MKKATIISVIFIFILALTVFAEVKNDILLIPKTSVAPTIDAVMDPVYQNHSEILVVREDPSDTVNPDDWFDCFGRAYMLWDDVNLYFFLQVNDETTNTGTNHEYDGVELYFDADESKQESYDGLDDVQLRFNLGESTPDEIDAGYGNGGNWEVDRNSFDYIV
ncbi:hypothetical protein JW998_07865, partial [candidate division KSB1 bacterium]|nr:hypothetical protein [candidate division KSB1 bacterium]